jgi:hypothetical protein
MISFQFAPCPVVALGIAVEGNHHVPIKRLHDGYPRQHGMTVLLAQKQCLDRNLPRRQVGYRFRKRRDVIGDILQAEQLPAVWQKNRIFEFGRPRQNEYSGNDLGRSPSTDPIPSGLSRRSRFVLSDVLLSLHAGLA